VRPAFIADQKNFDQQQRQENREWIVGARLDFEDRTHARAQP